MIVSARDHTLSLSMSFLFGKAFQSISVSLSSGAKRNLLELLSRIVSIESRGGEDAGGSSRHQETPAAIFFFLLFLSFGAYIRSTSKRDPIRRAARCRLKSLLHCSVCRLIASVHTYTAARLSIRPTCPPCINLIGYEQTGGQQKLKIQERKEEEKMKGE